MLPFPHQPASVYSKFIKTDFQSSLPPPLSIAQPYSQTFLNHYNNLNNILSEIHQYPSLAFFEQNANPQESLTNIILNLKEFEVTIHHARQSYAHTNDMDMRKFIRTMRLQCEFMRKKYEQYLLALFYGNFENYNNFLQEAYVFRTMEWE